MEKPDFSTLSSQEWLLTNGIGGFASGTVAGCATRRYHSLLTVALDPPSGRRMSLLGGLDETLIIDGTEYPLATHVYEDGTVYPNGWQYLVAFHDTTWEFQLPGDIHVQKELALTKGMDLLEICYKITCPDFLNLSFRIAPLVCWKEIHSEMKRWSGFPIRSELENSDWIFQATDDSPILRLRVFGGKWNKAGWWNESLHHAVEQFRGFDSTEELFCPSHVTRHLKGRKRYTVTLRATTLPVFPNFAAGKPTPLDLEIDYKIRRGPSVGSMFIASKPAGRTTILAGYPWFTDWGRDTFIALPGLCLASHREETARQIVRDFVPWIKNGRIPNRFPDNQDEPAYNNVDGTLWFIRCIGLCGLATELAKPLQAMIDAHLAGTVGDGIYADTDGLLRSGNDHTNLTWMDAKVEGVAITPRYDRPVEVQALWINALRVAGRSALADKAQEAFLARFVRTDGLGLYDCLLPDGPQDPSIRPNQVIAAALLDLPDSVNRAILAVATEHLLTPYGLRTLSPTDPRFRPRYEGGPHARDCAYHQGTVWPWLIGSFCDLYKKVHGANAAVTPFLTELERHRTEDYGLGGIAEVFDGAAPHRPNGCPWQAWSLAEVLRSKTAHPDRVAAPVTGDL